MRGEREGDGARLTNVDFSGERRGSTAGEVLYDTPSGEKKSALPRFVDGTEIAAGGRLADVDRRRELARLVTQSPDLPRAAASMVWSQLFDYGLLRPLNDQPATNDPHAAVVDRLATEFSNGGYDLKNLIRWAVLSEPFTHSTKLTDIASKDMPEAGEPPLFSRFYARPLPQADAANLLTAATRIRRTAGSDAERQQARIDSLAQFNRAPVSKGAKGADKSKSPPPKADAATQATAGARPPALIRSLATSSMAYEKKVEHLFLAALERRPAPAEARAAAALLTASNGSQGAALEDLWWALVNSSECVVY
jgi:hypothetical protein